MRQLFIIVLVLCLAACASAPAAVTGADVAKAFETAGLEAANVREMTKDDYGAAPFVCKGTRFFIPSLGEERGGRIFVCTDDKERDSLAAYYTELGKSSALFFSWVFVKGNVVVQINGNLPEATARQYEAAIP